MIRPAGDKKAPPCKTCGGTGEVKAKEGGTKPCPACRGAKTQGYQTK